MAKRADPLLDPAHAPSLPVSAMISRALDACARVMEASGREALVTRLREGDSTTWRHFRHCLAERVGAWLGALDSDMEAIYLYEPDSILGGGQVNRQGVVKTVHLLVHARRTTAAQLALVEALGRALAAHAAERFGLPETAHLLDVQVVTDSDLERSAGHTRLLSGLRLLAHEVWTRQP